MARECSNCRYFDDVWPAKAKGQCTRYPPFIPSYDEGSLWIDNGVLGTDYPVVPRSNNCGEHRYRKPWERGMK